MSQTVRISDGLYEAIDEYREKDQRFQDIIEEMAKEHGIHPHSVGSADALRTKLQSTYDLSEAEVQPVLNALRFVYIAQERPNSIGLPHAVGDRRYGDEIDTLLRLGLVDEHHYTGKHDYGYRTTADGTDIGSELVREQINNHDGDLKAVFDAHDEALLGVILQFGFNKTDSSRLTDRGAELEQYSVPKLWDIPELKQAYKSFKNELAELGIAAKYTSDGSTRVVLPPELHDYIRDHVNPEKTAVMETIEVLETMLDYTDNELNTRSGILNRLELATEEQFAETVEEFRNAELTSPYQETQDAPFLIKDSDGVKDRVHSEIKELLGLSAN